MLYYCITVTQLYKWWFIHWLFVCALSLLSDYFYSYVAVREHGFHFFRVLDGDHSLWWKHCQAWQWHPLFSEQQIATHKVSLLGDTAPLFNRHLLSVLVVWFAARHSTFFPQCYQTVMRQQWHNTPIWHQCHLKCHFTDVGPIRSRHSGRLNFKNHTTIQGFSVGWWLTQKEKGKKNLYFLWSGFQMKSVPVNASLNLAPQQVHARWFWIQGFPSQIFISKSGKS